MKFIKILKKYEIFLCQMKHFNTYKKNDECMIIFKEFVLIIFGLQLRHLWLIELPNSVQVS